MKAYFKYTRKVYNLCEPFILKNIFNLDFQILKQMEANIL